MFWLSNFFFELRKLLNGWMNVLFAVIPRLWPFWHCCFIRLPNNRHIKVDPNFVYPVRLQVIVLYLCTPHMCVLFAIHRHFATALLIWMILWRAVFFLVFFSKCVFLKRCRVGIISFLFGGYSLILSYTRIILYNHLWHHFLLSSSSL